ncbi:hypothetical protein RT717_20485 [Imperialibacter roseus]|uniref:Uncharacterized protein n=1 Tax=Imperialibacter roseus TaxID=1324217 RepID=A0ABZ0ILP3_9BACT|nr:hypothetical protein [Imperialibacter roseus]WOK05456.1 hypothetical protein RT717_20485 [Imperialibacter roseus]
MMSDKILTRPWTEFELNQKLAKMPVLPEYKLLIQVREILLDSRLANERLDSLIELIEKIPLHRSQEERDIFIEHLQEVLVDVRLSSELTVNVVKLLRSIERQS